MELINGMSASDGMEFGPTIEVLPVPAIPITIPVTLECVPFTGLENVLSNVAWYYFTLASTTTLTFDTLGSTGSPDTMIGVYDSTGALLGYDDDSGPGVLSTLTLTDLAPGTYYIAAGYYYIDFGLSDWNAVGDTELVDDCTIKFDVTPPPPPPNTAPLQFEIDSSLGSLANPLQFQLLGSNVNVLVEWGDGNTVQITGNNPITPGYLYSTNSIYIANIKGQANGFVALGSDPLLKVLDWGDLVGFDTLVGALEYSPVLSNVPNYLHPNVTNLSNLFSSTFINDSNISLWDTSNVTNLSGTFQQAWNFNQYIGNWNTSNVSNMAGMFQSANSFNQDIGNWDTSYVTNMANIFNSATSFNQNIGGWDTSNVYFMNSMFANASSFDGNIESWNVSGTYQMNEMFNGATTFNQDLINWCVINIPTEPTNFDTNTPSWVKTGRQPIWGTCPVPVPVTPPFITQFNPLLYTTTAGFIFEGDTNVSIDWGDGNVETHASSYGSITHNYGGNTSVKTISIMGKTLGISYINIAGFTHINSWGELQNCTNISVSGANNLVAVPNTAPPNPSLAGFFENCGSFNDANIEIWNTANISNMRDMFNRATSFNRNINSWNTNNVTNMANMFYQATSFNQSLNSWNVGNVSNMRTMFGGATAFNNNIGSWDTSKVSDMSGTFSGATAFNNNIGSWNTSNVTSMRLMFYSANSFNQNISSWNVSAVTDMNGMFSFASTFNQPLNSWNVSNVTDMTEMFRNATLFNNDLGLWDVTGVPSVNTMRNMFYRATSFNQNLSGWCVTNITSQPVGFDFQAYAWANLAWRPVWGTCPP